MLLQCYYNVITMLLQLCLTLVLHTNYAPAPPVFKSFLNIIIDPVRWSLYRFVIIYFTNPRGESLYGF